MASIVQVGDRFRAQVRLSGHRPVSKYCDTAEEAAAWAKATERHLRANGSPARSGSLTVAGAVEIYRRVRRDSGRPILPESNQHYMLEHLAADLGPEIVAQIEPRRLTAWAQERARQGAGPFTVNMELSALGTVLRTVAAFENLQLPDVVGQARPLLHHLQLIGGGNRRTRRPVGDELERVLAWFEEHRPQYRDAVELAVLSGIRRGELVRLRWADVDAKRKTVLVRDRKHPRRQARHDDHVPLFGDAWAVLTRQPRDGELIFPIHPQTLTKAFTDCCRELGIPNLHFHDLRREANHRLREWLDREERKAVLGHRSDKAHDHYLALTPEELHAKVRKARRRK